MSDAEREIFLRKECADDETIVHEVRQLLDHHQVESAALDHPVKPVVPDSIGADLVTIGDSVGKYEIVRKLGEGGMGIVYLAAQSHPQRSVALKMIRPDVSSPDVLRRFDLEATMLGRLQHPGIAQIFEAGFQAINGRDVPFLVMEYIEGPNLKSYLRSATFSVNDRVRLMVRIVEAVHYAHQRGVIHRDLKPANVLVQTDGVENSKGGTAENPRPKILDFGVARATDGDLRATTFLTGHGQLVGTLYYMSPEQAAGQQDAIDVRSDVYSLGVILYEMLSGKLPFGSDSAVETLRQVQQDLPTQLSRIAPNIPSDLEAICSKCLEKQPRSRYPTAHALGEDLERFLEGVPVTARRLGFFARSGRWCQRRPAIAGLMATTAALVIALTVGGSWFGWQQSRLRKVAVGERQRAEAVRDYLVETFRSPDPWLEGPDVTVAEALNNAIDQLDSDWPEPTASKGALLDAFAKTLMSWGEYERAAELARISYEVHSEVFGKEHEDTLSSATILASALRQSGDLSEALALAEKTYPALLRVAGAGSPKSVQCSNVLVYCQSTSDLSKSLELAESTYEEASERLGEFHADTMNALAVLVAMRRKQGGVKALSGYLSDLVELAESKLGKDNKVVFELRGMLGQNLRLAGDLATALAVSEQHYRQAIEIFGNDHPITWTCLNNLGTIHADRGQLSDLLPITESLLKKREEKLGPNHEDTILSLQNLGLIFFNLSRDREALEVLSDCKQRCYDSLGERHPQTLYVRSALGSVHWGLGEFEKATKILRPTLEDMEEVLGENHPKVLATKLSLAKCFNGTEKYEEALKILEPTYDALVEELGSTNIRSMNCATSLVTAYRGLGQLERAIELQTSTMEDGLTKLGEKHPVVLTNRLNTAVLLFNAEKYEESSEQLNMLLKSLADADETPLNQITKCRAELTLAEVLIAQEQFADAESKLIAANQQIRSLPEGHPQTSSLTDRLRNDFFGLYKSWSKPEEAAKWQDAGKDDS